MAGRSDISISSRKHPKQARSSDLVSAILQAAVQVLVEEGAPRFTTARVAEKAGVSIGSLYQYFPNKASILFRLQSDEWRETGNLLRTILQDQASPPATRLRALVHAFIRSECEEAAVRGALADTAPLYRDTPEAREAKGATDLIFEDFMCEALSQTTTSVRILAGDLIMTTLSTVGKEFSDTRHTEAEINAFSDAMADMFCAYLAKV